MAMQQSVTAWVLGRGYEDGHSITILASDHLYILLPVSLLVPIELPLCHGYQPLSLGLASGFGIQGSRLGKE